MHRARRFDTALMRPPAPGSVVEPALLRTVRDWCWRGALPRTTQPVAFGSIAPHDGLDGVACCIDGSHALARMGRLRGLAWRLQVLIGDHIPGRALRPDDPWDCGWWRDATLAGVPALIALRPRRPTLLMLQDPGPAVIEAMRAGFAATAVTTSKPLRLLVIADTPLAGMERLVA